MSAGSAADVEEEEGALPSGSDDEEALSEGEDVDPIDYSTTRTQTLGKLHLQKWGVRTSVPDTHGDGKAHAYDTSPSTRGNGSNISTVASGGVESASAISGVAVPSNRLNGIVPEGPVKGSEASAVSQVAAPSGPGPPSTTVVCDDPVSLRNLQVLLSSVTSPVDMTDAYYQAALRSAFTTLSDYSENIGVKGVQFLAHLYACYGLGPRIVAQLRSVELMSPEGAVVSVAPSSRRMAGPNIPVPPQHGERSTKRRRLGVQAKAVSKQSKGSDQGNDLPTGAADVPSTELEDFDIPDTTLSAGLLGFALNHDAGDLTGDGESARLLMAGYDNLQGLPQPDASGSALLPDDVDALSDITDDNEATPHTERQLPEEELLSELDDSSVEP